MRAKPLQYAVLVIVLVIALAVCSIIAIAVVDAIRYGGSGGPAAQVPASLVSGDAAQRGLAIYNRHCSGCHSVDGSKRVGPSYRGLYGSEVRLADGSTVVADETYLRESIASPSARIVAGYGHDMPQFDDLRQQDVDDLIAFIRSLG